MTVTNLCAAVAAALGEEWTLQWRNVHSTYSVRERDGLELDLHDDGARLHASVRYVAGIDLDGDPHAFGARPAPHITASNARSVTALIADIRRRLLPVADAWYADACRRALLVADRRHRQQANAAQLLALPQTQRSPTFDNRVYGVDWQADVTSDAISLRFSTLSPDLALRLLRLYHGLDPITPEVTPCSDPLTTP